MKIRVAKSAYKIWDDHDLLPLPERLEKAGRICYKSEDKIGPGTADKFVQTVIKLGHNSVLEMGSVTAFIGPVDAVEYAELLKRQPKYLHITRNNTGVTMTGSYRAVRDFYIQNPTCGPVAALLSYMIHKWPVLGHGLDLEAVVKPAKGLAVLPAAMVAEDFKDFKKHKHIMVRFTIGRHTSHELVRHRPMGVLQESQRYCNYSTGKFGSVITVIEPVGLNPVDYDLWFSACNTAARAYFRLLERNQPQVARTVLPNSCKTEVLVYANLEQWAHIFSLRDSPKADPSMVEVMRPLHAEFKERFLL